MKTQANPNIEHSPKGGAGRGLPLNNNPLNIRRVAGTHWKGELPESTPPLGGDGGGLFVRFESMEWGLRAAFVLLRTYSTKYKLNCIRDIISRWAPPSENNTEKYIQNVCLWTGFGGNERLTETEWPRLVRAMARQECGVILDEDVIQKGFALFKGIQN